MEIAAKKKPTGAVDPQSELLGVFWLTYFNAAYVAFFGKDRLVSSPGVNIHSNGCATVQLGESPATVPSGLRQEVATSLGKEAFVDTKSVLIKPPGRFALTFQQLLLSQSTAAPRDWAN